MTVLILIRHAEADGTGSRLYGRLPGVGLNARGLGQARRLAHRLASTAPIAAIYSSPLERACATAAPLAALLGETVRTHPGPCRRMTNGGATISTAAPSPRRAASRPRPPAIAWPGPCARSPRNTPATGSRS